MGILMHLDYSLQYSSSHGIYVHSLRALMIPDSSSALNLWKPLLESVRLDGTRVFSKKQVPVGGLDWVREGTEE